mmetsp:Transcript_40872/g.73846  ORF Transcript_40872/g.73846 Transcript_40872/m.73846 type:complete len:684 (-) Transcript_40872:39-2090(-)
MHLTMTCITGTVHAPAECEVTEPLWYVEFMLLMRFLTVGSPSAESQGFKPPPRAVQFLVHLISAPATCNFLETGAVLASRMMDVPEDGENGVLAAMGAVMRELEETRTDDDVWHEQMLLAYHGSAARHAGDVLVACQYILEKLYASGDSKRKDIEAEPLNGDNGASNGNGFAKARELKRLRAMQATFSGVLLATSFHFGTELALGRGSEKSAHPSASDLQTPRTDGSSSAAPPRRPHPKAAVGSPPTPSVPRSASPNPSYRERYGSSSNSGYAEFASLLQQLRFGSACLQNPGDRFLRCLRDVLCRILGPPPETLEEMPELAPPLSRQSRVKPAAAGGKLNGNSSASAEESPMKAQSSLNSQRCPSRSPERPGGFSTAGDTLDADVLDIRLLARIARTILQAYYTDPALLAAREAVRGRREDAWHCVSGANLITTGSYGGTVEWTDLVAVPEQGPLRRNLAFMEQSPLLQVVHSKLRAAEFRDVVGATERVSAYALRNIRILWFDMRRCTSTLKKDTAGEESPRKPGKSTNAAFVVLGIRNLTLCLTSDWEATLATFPYLSVSGGSHVTVKGLAVSIHAQLSLHDGIAFPRIEVGEPEVEVQLSCSSTLSQVALSIVLAILQESLQQQIQRQLQRILDDLLRREAVRWNHNVWRRITLVTPRRLICDGLAWIGKQLPPEGVPI